MTVKIKGSQNIKIQVDLKERTVEAEVSLDESGNIKEVTYGSRKLALWELEFAHAVYEKFLEK